MSVREETILNKTLVVIKLKATIPKPTAAKAIKYFVKKSVKKGGHAFKSIFK
jgi:hypothetical protein